MKPHSSRPKIAVIGAGWAGLSAAVSLVQRADVTLFEAGKQAGGRARTAGGNSGFSFLDNGQHICLGAYRGVLSLLSRIGVSEQEAFHRLPLQWYLHDGMRLQTASLPAPFHILFGILFARNISFNHKIRLLRDMNALKKYHHQPSANTNIAAWLNARRTPRKLVAEFWQPLVWGALNTPLEQAGLNTLCNVLQDGVWADKAGSDYLMPKRDLGSIVARPALAYLQRQGANIRLETRVPPLENLPCGRVKVNGETFDAAILAVAPYHAAALLPAEVPHNLQTAYQQMSYHAITTVYLRYACPVPLPAAMTGLANGTAQWFVSRGAIGLPDNEVAAVISLSDNLGTLKTDEWVNKVHSDLLRICPNIGEPVESKVITEKRATTAAITGRPLPDVRWLQHHRIYPAGDYLHPRYPATLEAAVQSGITAADLCCADLKAVCKTE
ncbi:hydroxysqualene dehydroxylase HpnE [Neisseria animalis]|uniref:FAD-dependent oxidoreductase n=1 Tax=Neisseria animalis TaxID=492 RepID=A0A5P3MTB2_NEIAN|nr:hydroxysqualene dehydroxylase HpnE [Neisseria animalis]QEY24804.1 FAD-dependent oxidoreductase [Neisseria animalis]ROW31526.1 FAD-dependent oxidoreductase [Neisseria animalis]VEE07679.1 oxidoreductase [Neisseria animalis]